MPNWCYNTLKIKGDEKELLRFKKKAKGSATDKTELSLEKLLPKPPNLPWDQWTQKNWGTKWDVHANIEEENEYELVYDFDSAWSPPLEGITTISKDFPKLIFIMTYEEEGCCFQGLARIENGDIEDHSITTA